MDNNPLGNRQRIIGKAEQEGFGPQMAFLIAHGFTTPSQNLKYLRRHSGDQQAALEELKGKGKQGVERKKKSLEDDMGEAPRKEDREEWDEMLKIVFLDGNNLLFIDSTIRTLSLKKQIEKAEACIVKLAEEFAKTVALKKVVVVFDDTRLPETGLQFDRSIVEVRKARPGHRTADDYLVALLPSLGQQDSTGFVTSDRELIQRLGRAGAKNLVRSGKWFSILKAKLGGKYDEVLSSTCKSITK